MDVIIVNPVAGNGKSLEYLAYIKNLYVSFARDYLVVFTNGDGAMPISQYYSSQDTIENIVSIGGDGTVNEIVNGMIDHKKGLIVIPGGTGNDFFRSLDNYPNTFYCDVGKANNDYFLGTLSIGVDALVADIANKLKLEGRKGNVYLESVLKCLPTFENTKVAYISDEKKLLRNVTLLSFSNANYYGRGIKISPNAKLDDGLFEVCLASKMARIRVPLVFIKLLLGCHENDKLVETFQTSNGTIRFNEPTLYSFDGEIRKDNEIKLTILPKKLLIKQDFHDEIKKLTKKRF